MYNAVSLVLIRDAQHMDTHLLKMLVKKMLRKKKIILCILVCETILLYTHFHTDVSLENVSCYYSYEDDILPAIGKHFAPPEKSIHFHETSCSGLGLNSRQACAVESAARVHPHWQIIVYFTGPLNHRSMNSSSFQVLKNYPNVLLLRVHVVEYATDTPLEDLVSGGALNRTQYRVSHTSDAMRYLSLYKWGGVYLDLDMVVVRSFEELAPNWAARQTTEYSRFPIGAGAMAFSRDALGRQFAETAIMDLCENFRGDMWGQNGPGVITRTLQKLCGTTDTADMSAASCRGFEVYPVEMFYPVPWWEAHDYFKYQDLEADNPFTHHMWNRLTMKHRVNKSSVYAKLAQEFCPAVYQAYGDDFGQ